MTNTLAPDTDAVVGNVDTGAEPLFQQPSCKTHFVTQMLCFGWFITQPPLKALTHMPEEIRQKSREKQNKIYQSGPLWGAEGAAQAANFLFDFH